MAQKMAQKTTWTPARRAAQAARIRAARIWDHSTGPRSAAGKARVSRNALKPGNLTRREHNQMRLVKNALRAQALFLKLLRALPRHLALTPALAAYGRHVTMLLAHATQLAYSHP